MLFIFPILAAIVLAQPTPSAQGIQIAGGSYNIDIGAFIDIRFPLTVAQCEPVLIFYNTTSAPGDFYIWMGHDMTQLGGFSGIGYLEWICNIPAGHGFSVEFSLVYYVVVQPGPISSCLHNLTTTYKYAHYSTESFAAYTAGPTNTTQEFLYQAMSTVPFPVGSFSTISVNPELIVSIPRSLISSSKLDSTALPSHFASSISSASSRKSKAPAIAGGVIGGVAIVIAFVVILIRFRKRPRQPRDVPFDFTNQTLATPRPVGGTSNAPAPGSSYKPAIKHAITLRSTRDPSMPHSDRLRPTGKRLPARKAGNESLTRLAPVIAPTPGSQTSTLAPETVHPLVDGPVSSDSGILQQDASPNPAPNLSSTLPLPEPRPALDTDSDVLAILNTFSQLPLEQRRELFPVLSRFAGTPQPLELSMWSDTSSAPPSYRD